MEYNYRQTLVGNLRLVIDLNHLETPTADLLFKEEDINLSSIAGKSLSPRKKTKFLS